MRIRAPLPRDTTCRMRPGELRELVRITTPSARPRLTSEMPRVELLALLRENLDLGASPLAIEPEVTERIRGRAGIPVTSTSRLVLAFLGAVLTGALLTVPIW